MQLPQQEVTLSINAMDMMLVAVSDHSLGFGNNHEVM